MMKLDDIKVELDVHFKRVDAILPEMKSYMPLCVGDFEDIEKIKTIDAFVYRFIKIQDKMGSKLFPLVLQALQEYESTMALIDVLNKLETLGLITRVDDWLDFRKLRNALTHEYSNNENEILEALHSSIEVYDSMKKIYYNLLKRVGL